MGTNSLSAMELDAIGEILNISLGASATAVSTMLSTRVDITTPEVLVLSKEEFQFEELEPAVGVEINYVEGLSGSNMMLLKREDVRVIVETLMGMDIPDEEFELNELNISAVCEVMNQMMGSSATALSELFGKIVNISTPTSFEVNDLDEFKTKYFGENERMVVVRFMLKVEGKLESEFLNMMPIPLAREMVSGFFPGGEDEIVTSPVEESGQVEETPKVEEESSNKELSQDEIAKLFATANGEVVEEAPASSNKELSQDEIEKLFASANEAKTEEAPASSNKELSQDEIEKLFASANETNVAATVETKQTTPTVQPTMSEVATSNSSIDMMAMMQRQQQQFMDQMQQMNMMMQTMMQASMQNMMQPQQKQVKVQNVVRPDFSGNNPNNNSGQELNMDLIMGVSLDVSVEIGRTKRLVKEILEFNKGTLVVLDKLAGEQVDLFVNGQCIAKGDVVVIDDNFGIRITEILKENIKF